MSGACGVGPPKGPKVGAAAQGRAQVVPPAGAGTASSTVAQDPKAWGVNAVLELLETSESPAVAKAQPKKLAHPHPHPAACPCETCGATDRWQRMRSNWTLVHKQEVQDDGPDVWSRTHTCIPCIMKDPSNIGKTCEEVRADAFSMGKTGRLKKKEAIKNAFAIARSCPEMADASTTKIRKFAREIFAGRSRGSGAARLAEVAAKLLVLPDDGLCEQNGARVRRVSGSESGGECVEPSQKRPRPSSAPATEANVSRRPRMPAEWEEDSPIEEVDGASLSAQPFGTCSASIDTGASAPCAASGGELRDWLASVDDHRGQMLQYLEPLVKEFGSMLELAAAVVPAQPGVSSVLSRVEPVVFEILGVRALGHRLLLAKALVRLADESEQAGSGCF